MVRGGSLRIGFKVVFDSIGISGLVGIIVFIIVNSEDLFPNPSVYSFFSFRNVSFNVVIVVKEFRV